MCSLKDDRTFPFIILLKKSSVELSVGNRLNALEMISSYSLSKAEENLITCRPSAST